MSAAWARLGGPGFLGTRAPLFPDIVVTALALVIALFAVGVLLARRGRRRTHGAVMGATYAVLLAVVAAFVAWNAGERAAHANEGGVHPALKVGHILCALATLATGAAAALIGGRSYVAGAAGGGIRLPEPARRRHRRTGRAMFALLFATTASGVAIYWLRYVAG